MGKERSGRGQNANHFLFMPMDGVPLHHQQQVCKIDIHLQHLLWSFCPFPPRVITKLNKRICHLLHSQWLSFCSWPVTTSRVFHLPIHVQILQITIQPTVIAECSWHTKQLRSDKCCFLFFLYVCVYRCLHSKTLDGGILKGGMTESKYLSHMKFGYLDTLVSELEIPRALSSSHSPAYPDRKQHSWIKCHVFHKAVKRKGNQKHEINGWTRCEWIFSTYGRIQTWRKKKCFCAISDIKILTLLLSLSSAGTKDTIHSRPKMPVDMGMNVFH